MGKSVIYRSPARRSPLPERAVLIRRQPPDDTFTITEAAKLYRIPRSTLFYRMRQAGHRSINGRYPIELLEQIATASRARPRIPDAQRRT